MTLARGAIDPVVTAWRFAKGHHEGPVTAFDGVYHASSCDTIRCRRAAAIVDGLSTTSSIEHRPLLRNIRTAFHDLGYCIHPFSYVPNGRYATKDTAAHRTMDAYCQLLADFVSSLAADHVLVAAHSFGGLFAAEYMKSSRRDPRIDKYILVAAPTNITGWKKYSVSPGNAGRYKEDFSEVKDILLSIRPRSSRLAVEIDTLVLVCQGDQDNMLHQNAFGGTWGHSGVEIRPVDVRSNLESSLSRRLDLHSKLCTDGVSVMVDWLRRRLRE